MKSDDPVHALTVEPRSARAGESVRVSFRMRNCGSLSSPAGTVRFALGEGLEPLGPSEVPVDPVDPGADVTASIQARVLPPSAERAEIELHAELALAGRVLATNACRVLVRSRPLLDGPASGTFVEAAGRETVRVRAVVTNEGDGPAGMVRIALPAPLGCVHAEPDEPAELVLDGLAAGASAELVVLARIVSPVAEIRAAEGAVELSGGRRVALPVREVLRLEAVLAAPVVTLVRARRRVEISVAVRNDGWVDARGVRVRIALPAGLRPVEGGLGVDGMPLSSVRRAAGSEPIATLVKERDARTIVLAAVPARTTVGVVLAATFEPACAVGTIRAAVDGTWAETPFEPHHARDVRARIVAAPHTTAPGDTVTVAARIENAGDVTEELSCAFEVAGARESAPSRAYTLVPGSAALVDVPLTVPAALPDGARCGAELVVFDAAGERARAAFDLLVRRRDGSDVGPPDDADDEFAPTEIPGDAAFSVRLVLEIAPSGRGPAMHVEEPPAALPQADFADAAGDPMEFRLRLDAARIDEIERLGHGFRAAGLVGHLFALRLFFPESAGRDAHVAAALEDVRGAVRDVFDRLFVKLRIPGYAVSCEDVEDAPLRAAIIELLQRLDDGADGGAPAALVSAPYGAPIVLRALTALLPSRCEDDPRLGASIARHAALLDDALAGYEGAPLELFDDALERRSTAVLDDARENVLAALSAHRTPFELAC